MLCFDGDAAGQKAAMRAALRALPMLKPGHSLRICDLAGGAWTRTISSSNQGQSALSPNYAGCFRTAGRTPLENRSGRRNPLDTPEDRAGLKQRLGGHVANIADAEIRRHYADAFRERFRQPVRTQAPRAISTKRRRAKRKARDWRAPQIPCHPGARNQSHSTPKIPTFLVQGVLGGSSARAGADSTASGGAGSDFVPPRPGIMQNCCRAMLDSALSHSGKETLDSAALLTILGDDLYNMAQALLQGNGTAFAFNRQSGMSGKLAGAQAFRQLDEAIRLMKQRPELEAALQRATELASTDLNEANFAEQQRLRQEKHEFDMRLAALLQREDVL
jgi:DNA primase